MVWQAQSMEDGRQEFVRLAKQHTISFRQLCARFEVSAPTGYKWVQRAESGEADWAQDRSRRPRRCPTQTVPEIEAQVVTLRQQYPAWGGRKLRQLLAQQGVEPLPAPSTITSILHRHGLIDAAATA